MSRSGVLSVEAWERYLLQMDLMHVHLGTRAELECGPKVSGCAQHPGLGYNMHGHSWQIICHGWHVLGGC